MDVVEEVLALLDQSGMSAAEVKEEAIMMIVADFLTRAQQEGLDPFQSACALYEFAIVEGHDSGHDCATRQAGSHDHDAEDVRALAGYL